MKFDDSGKTRIHLAQYDVSGLGVPNNGPSVGQGKGIRIIVSHSLLELLRVEVVQAELIQLVKVPDSEYFAVPVDLKWVETETIQILCR